MLHSLQIGSRKRIYKMVFVFPLFFVVIGVKAKKIIGAYLGWFLIHINDDSHFFSHSVGLKGEKHSFSVVSTQM